MAIEMHNGRGLSVTSQNEFIATVKASPPLSGTGPMTLVVEGKSVGTTYIKVGDRKGTMVQELEVRVRDKLEYPICFWFVTDSTSEKTTRSTFVSDLLDSLDNTFSTPTNVGFTVKSNLKVEIETILRWIVKEQKYRTLDDIDPTGREWQKLVGASDPNALNVFFMPWHGPADMRPARLFGKDRVCVCDDDMSDPEVAVALPHMVACMLGCKPNFDLNQKHHLLFDGRATGVEPIEGHNSSLFGSFITKNCNHMVNPY
jgi:hypothetical protein